MKHKTKGQNTMMFCLLLYIISVQKNHFRNVLVGGHTCSPAVRKKCNKMF